MTEPKHETKREAPKDDGSKAAGDVQKQVDAETEQGFLGEKIDPRDNADYALTSGPDSPPAVEDTYTRVEHHSVRPAES